MPNALLVMVGGAIGAVLRYEVGRVPRHRLGPGFPGGTLMVNLVGGLLIGLLAGYMFSRNPPDQALWMFAAVGLLGGFTTFSAFSFDPVAMLEQGRLRGTPGCGSVRFRRSARSSPRSAVCAPAIGWRGRRHERRGPRPPAARHR